MVNPRESTHGEKVVRGVLQKLPKSDYYVVQEPRINTPTGALRPDFVIISRQHGVIIIEVKDYIEILEGSNQKTVLVRNAKGGILSLNNPEETSYGYAVALYNEFEKYAELMSWYDGKIRLAFPYQNVVIFPNISKSDLTHLEKSGIFTPNLVWSRQTLISAESVQESIKRLPWKFKLTQAINEPTFNVIRGVINPELVISDTETKKPVGFLSVAQEILTKEALEAAESSNVRLVRGVAGSGKSLVLVYRAHYIAQNYPDKKVLALAFNVDLADDLKKRINTDAITVINFHKICTQVIKDSGKRWHSPIDRVKFLKDYVSKNEDAKALGERFLDEEIGWRKEVGLEDNQVYLTVERKGRGKSLLKEARAIVNRVYDEYQRYQQRMIAVGEGWRDWEDVAIDALELLVSAENPHKHAYDVIMIDEAQDFAPVWLAVVKQLLKPNGTLFICDDPTQSIFRQYSWEEKGIPVRGRTKVLSVPYRCTKQITELAYAVVVDSLKDKPSDDVLSPNMTSPFVLSGQTPQLIPCKDEQTEIKRVVSIVEEWGKEVSYAKIAILCTSKSMIKHWAHLREKGVYVEHFGKMKGLEFQAVMIPFLCKSMNTTLERDEEFINLKRRELFTAFTRARTLLALSYHGELPAELAVIKPHVFINP